MKKLITLILVAVMVLSMACANVFTVSATETPTNYWTEITFNSNSIATKDTVDGEEVYVYAPNPFYRWSSPYFNIRPAFEAAIGDGEDVELTLTFKIKAKFTEGNEGYEGSSCSIRMRGHGYTGTNLAIPDLFMEEYEESLGGSEAVFHSDGSHILGDFPSAKRIGVVDTEWKTFSVDLYFDRNQIFDSTVPIWTLCIDTLGGAHIPPASHYEIYECLMFKDFGVYLTEEYEAAFATPTPTPTATPTPKPAEDKPADEGDADVPKATATAKPTSTATKAPAATEKVTEDDKKDADSTGLIIGIVAGAVVVVGAVVAVVIILNKKKATATSATEEAVEEKAEE